LRNQATVVEGSNIKAPAEISDDLEIFAGAYVGSRNGSKYHFPWCPGAQQIKEENKVWFSSVEEAQKAGYTPAANCKGL